jgi:dTDP-D-glucose 4,6-dehydratase
MGSLAENKQAFFTEDSPFAPNSPYAASKQPPNILFERRITLLV